FGVLLVVAYGVGMAAMLTAAGLVLVRVRDRWASRPRRALARLAALTPTDTAALVLCVGLGLTGRALLGVVHCARVDWRRPHQRGRARMPPQAWRQVSKIRATMG